MKARANPVAPPRNLERLGGLSWGHLVNDGAANFLPGILPALLIELNLSVGLAGTIVAALLIGQGLQPFVGLIGDRLGGRSLMIIGLLGTSIGAILVGFVDSTASLVVVLLLIGVSNSVYHPQSLASIRLIPFKRHGTAMSVFLIGGEIGRGIAPALASALVVALGRPWVGLLAIPGLLTVFLLPRWAPSLPVRSAKPAPIRWRAHGAPLAALVAFCSLRGLVIFVLITFMPLIWTEAGGGMTAGASLIAALYVVGVFGNLAGGWLGDRINKRVVLTGSMAVSVVLVALAAILHGPSLWVVCSLAGVALFSSLPLTVIIAQDILPESRAFGSGLALGLANALGAVALVIVSPLADIFSPDAPVWAACAAALIAFVIATRMPLPAHLSPDP